MPISPDLARNQADIGYSTQAHEVIQTTEHVVIDSIEHSEPPAVIDEDEAAQIVAVQHASFIELTRVEHTSFIERTHIDLPFICVAPIRDYESAVAASRTDEHCRRANPRRRVAAFTERTLRRGLALSEYYISRRRLPIGKKM